MNINRCPVCGEGSRFLYRLNTVNHDNIILTCEECNSTYIDPNRMEIGQAVSNRTLYSVYGGTDAELFNSKLSGWASKVEICQSKWNELLDVNESFIHYSKKSKNKIK
ncbi:hypothetical protein PPL_00233 [Heterostelium album PN500]|uniref:Uncharacterized protein n=1 Tax=Heterostelium pallidum (strain ATCC 26659 / Pp 5 / PN500) TaxID=670386 RepID=D3AVW8_HETP5|nr:hypothetical protein PPL_00233 [Heterostelium album PN500]EFA86441.1 hypothetical protein PPL_00233 [Heterostelium album PN500]|eukprot:XP_020438546.1 hypothetical protein PPL_00233 [Heterostelium album PN500]